MLERSWSLRVCLLGQFRVELNGADVAISVRKNRALLAALALRPARVIARDEAVALLWPDSDEERARDSLRHALWRLRSDLGAAAESLVSRGDDLRLASEVAVDVREFEAAAASRDPERLAAAVALYTGDLCRELDGPEAESERTRLRGILAEAGLRFGEQRLSSDDSAGAVAAARAVLRVDPYREDLVRLLLRGHALAGDVAALGAEYRRFTELLRAELGVDPSPETRALYARLVTAEPEVGSPALIRRPQSGAPSTLVGRQSEHRRLIELLTDVIDGRGRALVLLGEAGAGKTALVSETTRIAANHGFRVLAARAAGAEGQLAYQVWRDALRPFASAAAALPSPWPSVLLALVPTNATEGGPRGVSPELERARLFDGVARLLSSLAATAPILVAVDDLHWVDADSIHLFHYLVRTLRGQRVAFIAAARPAEADASSAIVTARAQLRAASLLDELEVSSLGVDAVAELLRRVGVSADTTAWLARRMAAWTAGNPLFVLEATNALSEQGALRRSGGALEWVGTPPAEGEPLTVSLPTGVRQTLLARIGTLPTETRQMLNVAAAVGSTFAPELLAAATGRDEMTVVDALAPAIDARLLREAKLDGRPALAFTHDLVREATYQHMPSVMRSAVHRRVAAALESRGAPSALLAHHFTAASDMDRAAAHWIAAADQAERSFAHDEALRAYRAALAAMPATDVARRMDTIERAGDAHTRRGAVGDAIRSYDEAMVACDPAEPDSCARLGVKIALCCGRHYGEHPNAYEFAETGVEYFGARQPESAQMADALLALMAMQYQRGDTAAVQRTAERVRALARRIDLPRQEAGAMSLEAWARWLDGDAVYAPSDADVSRLVERLGDDDEASHLLACVGRAANRRGDFERALEVARSVERIAARVGSVRTEDIGAEIALGAMLNLGRWDDAIRLSRRRDELTRRITVQDVHDPLIARGTAQAMSGDLAAARATATVLAQVVGLERAGEHTLHQTTRNEALRVYLLAGMPEAFPPWDETAASRPRCVTCQHPWLVVTGAAHAVYGDRDEALRHADALEALLPRTGYAALDGYPWLIRAVVRSAGGPRDDSESAHREAVRRFEVRGNALGLAALRRLSELSMEHSTVRS